MRPHPPQTAPRSCSIDAAHPVDGDLFHQELVDVLLGHVLDVLGVLVLSQHPDLLWALAQPIAADRCQNWEVAASVMPEQPALRPAPDRRTTALPASFTVHEAPSTVHLDDGAVVLGGSPARLFRISARAQRLVERWRIGHPVGDQHGARLLARRLVSSGAYLPRPTTSGLGPDDVTVVIPVRDRPAQLDRLLHAVSGLACVVVDDASAQAGTTKEIAERHGARFVALADNCGPAGARNAGLAAVHSPLVAFVDSDCVPSPGWLEPLLGHFDDPVVGAVAPRVVPAPL